MTKTAANVHALQARAEGDEQEIRVLLDRIARAIDSKDLGGVVACYTDDIIAFDLAPPLKAPQDPATLQEWFDTWEGPIKTVETDVHLNVTPTLATVFALRHIAGTKKSDEKASLWFRSTAVMVKQRGTWKISHIHNSVPFAMDGTDKALLNLEPGG